MITALRTTVSVLKLRIGFFIAIAALVGILSSGDRLGWTEGAVFVLAVLGAAGAAGAFNQYFERGSDHLMARTASRPFVTGALKAGPVWPLTFSLLLAASLAMGWAVGGTFAALLIFLGAFTYAVIYTLLLKRRTTWNVVVGGAAGSFAMLAGSAAAAGPYSPLFPPATILLASMLFLWTPPHFWALAALRQNDYRNADIPMLPVVADHDTWGTIIFLHVVALVALSMGPLFFGFGLIYGLFAAIGGAWFLVTSWRLMREPSAIAARSTFLASLGQFALVSAGVILDRGFAWLF